MEIVKIVTNKVRFSYLNAFEPAGFEGQEKKYSVSLIIPKSDTATIDKINKGIEQLKEQFKLRNNGKVPGNFKTPLRDGDADRADDANYADSYFINASSKFQPGMVNKDLQAIIDPNELYSGCYGRASINLYLFDVSGNRGIAAGLNHLQKLADGPNLGGG